MEKDKVESRTEVENIDVAGKIADALGFKHDKCGGGHHSDPCDRCFAVAEILKALASRPSVPQRGQALTQVVENFLGIWEGADLFAKYWRAELRAALAASRSEEATEPIRCANCGQFIIAGTGVGCISIGEGEAACSNFCADEHERMGCPQESGKGYRDAKWYASRAAGSAERRYELALREITEGRGRFSLDHFQHAKNTIEDMKELAVRALAGTDTDVAKGE